MAVLSDALPDWAARHRVERRAEPLAESAPLAARWAQAHCRLDPATGAGCRTYHAKWQKRRLDGRDLGPGNDAPALAALIRGLASEGALRSMLVCGSADYGLLALVADALGDRTMPSITVLDLCETPLLLNRWFAQRYGLRVETIQGDALALARDGRYDLILAHTFLGFFEPASIEPLIARWHDALAPGGRVLVSHPLGPTSPSPTAPGPSAPRPTARDRPWGAQKRRADAIADAWRRDVPRTHFKVASPDALARPFAAAGFEIEAVLAARRPVKAAAGLGGLLRRLIGGSDARRKPAGRDHAIVLARRPTT